MYTVRALHRNVNSTLVLDFGDYHIRANTRIASASRQAMISAAPLARLASNARRWLAGVSKRTTTRMSNRMTICALSLPEQQIGESGQC